MNYFSKIGIGTVQFGLDYGISNGNGQTDVDEIKKILDKARLFNIKIIDTAKAYGSSEYVLGEVGVQDFKIVTKIFATNHLDVSNQINNSLSLLKTNKLYAVLVHNIKDIVSDFCIWESLLKNKKANRVSKIGFSFNEISEIEQVLKLKIVPDIIQIPFNILDHRFSDIAKYFKKKGCEIHTRSSFLQGLFFCNPNDLSDYFKDVKQYIFELQNNSKYLASDLLMYCLKQDFIDSVVIGLNNSNQLMEIINTLENSSEIIIDTPELSESVLAPSNWNL